jgi:hypothetical protein
MMRFKTFINESYGRYFRREKARKKGSRVNKTVSDYFEMATVVHTHNSLSHPNQHPEYLDHIEDLKTKLDTIRANNPHLKDRLDSQDSLAKKSSKLLIDKLSEKRSKEKDFTLQDVSEVRHVKNARHLFSLIGRTPDSSFSARRYPHDLMFKLRTGSFHGASLKGSEKDFGTYNNLGARRHSSEDTTGIASHAYADYNSARTRELGSNKTKENKESKRSSYLETRKGIVDKITKNFNGANSIDQQRKYLHSLLKPESDIPYYTVLPHRNQGQGEAILHGRGTMRKRINSATRLSATQHGNGVIQYHTHHEDGRKIPLFYVEHRSTKGPWGSLQFNVKLGQFKKEE